MEPNGLVEGLKALARDEAARPGGRDRMAAALRAALAEVEPHGVFFGPEAVAALGDMAAALIQAGDHAEYVAEKAGAFTTAPPPAPERH